jgi:hypothetical protein
MNEHPKIPMYKVSENGKWTRLQISAPVRIKNKRGMWGRKNKPEYGRKIKVQLKNRKYSCPPKKIYDVFIYEKGIQQ